MLLYLRQLFDAILVSILVMSYYLKLHQLLRTILKELERLKSFCISMKTI